MIKQVSDTCYISDVLARSLLLRCQWDADMITDRFYDSDMVLKQLNFDRSAKVEKYDPSSFWCPVCYEQPEQTMGMECGHRLCVNCYKDYLANQVTVGPDCIYTVCPQAPCKIIVPEEFFKDVCTPEQFKKYQYYYSKSFIDLNK